MMAVSKAMAIFMSCLIVVSLKTQSPYVGAQVRRYAGQAPTSPSDIAPSPSPGGEGDLVPFLLGFIGTTQQQGTSDNSTINLGFASSSNALSPGPAPAPGRRLLQGGFDTSNYNGDFSWVVDVTIVDAAGKSQGQSKAFQVILDTGSNDFVVPGAAGPSPFFDATGLPATGGPATNMYGGDIVYVYKGDFYAGTFTFAGATGKAAAAAPSNVLAADLYKMGATNPTPNGGTTILGLGFTGSLAQANVKGATTPLLDFFAAAKFSYQAFTFFLHETNPIVQTKNPVPDQGQLAFGGTLPNLVDPAAGISAPAYFQNVDLACYPIVPSPFGTNWAVPRIAVTSNPGAAPLGINNINFCKGIFCSAIVDTGYFEIAMPPDQLSIVFTALGLNPQVPVDGNRPDVRSFGRTSVYQRIDCSTRTKATPTLDFQIMDRVYSLSPGDYIQEYQDNCYAILGNTGKDHTFALGSPFIAKYPGTFFVTTEAPPAPLMGPSLAPRTCLYGTVPVVAQCNTPIYLPATQDCSALISEAALLAQLNDANKDVVFTSSPATPDRTQFTLQPGPGPNGIYKLPLGQSTFTLTATNSLGSSSCSATVNVMDEEFLDSSRISCGTPPSGVQLLPVLGKTSPAATYTATASKRNGCPVTISTSDLTCKNCLLGPGKATDIAKCTSEIVGNSVQIDPKQEGRLHWTVTVNDIYSSVTKDCDICASFDAINKCPTPYTASSPCVLGQF